MSYIVSVIVVAKNEDKNIAACLDSLVNQEFSSEQYEIIVVDGGSKDKTQEIVDRYPVKLIVDTYGTLGHQRNTGIENAQGKYIAFTDADCIADKAWLRTLVTAISVSSQEIAGIGGPNLVMPDDPDFAQIVGYSQETFFGSGGSPQAANSKKALNDVISIPNCNAIYKREVIVAEKYDNAFTMGEDAELNFRLRKKGFRFAYIPDAIVWHHRVAGYKRFALKMLAYGEGMAKVIKKHRDLTRWYAFIPSIAVLAFTFYVLAKIIYPEITYIDLFISLLIVVYLIGLLISALKVYRKSNNLKSLWTLIILPTQHLMYGLGFMKGIISSEATQ